MILLVDTPAFWDYNVLMSKKKQAADKQPYSNMFARRIVLLVGLGITVLGFLAVLLGALVLFVPDLDVIKGYKPITQIIYLLSAGLVACFVGVVLAVAGANTMKALARLAFFLGSVSFIVGAAILVICLFFKTVLPLPALERLAGGETAEAISMLL